MLFTSYEFLIFAAVLLVVYYLIPGRFQWMLLLAASWIFYFIAGVSYLPYLLATALTVWLTALKIERLSLEQKAYLKEHRGSISREEKKACQARQAKVRRRWMAAAIVFNLCILAVVKYANFFITNVNSVISATGGSGQISFLDIAMPMGISFYTLQAIGYLIDVNRGTYAAEKNFFRFALFVSFFPQLVQGPIGRYGELSKTLYTPHSFSRDNVSRGLQRVLWGYFKKMVIADRVLAGVSEITGNFGEYQGAFVFFGMLLYTAELFADFTGGIDITIGLSEALGVRLSENFDRPYSSKSLKEYWRRWHISMCSWFRDYVFYPVSVSSGMRRLGKFTGKHLGKGAARRIPVYISTFVVWFATGIWHGASWNFIVWGLANCIVLMISEELEPLYEKFHRKFSFSNKRGYDVFRVIRTFLLVCCLNLFDCYSSIAETAGAFASMFTAGNWAVLFNGALLGLGLTGTDYIILAAGIAVMFIVGLLQKQGSIRDRIKRFAYPARFAIWFALFLAVLLIGAYGIGYDASQFIYNQF